MIKYSNCGIYKIINNKNNRCYYGSSSDLKKRKRGHFKSLIKGNHVNSFLQRDFKKCGEEYFEFIIIEFVKKENLLEIEQKYLDQFWDGKKMCYNIRKKAQISSEEVIEKIRNSVSYNKNPNFGNFGILAKNSKKIYCFDMNEKLIGTYYGSKETERQTGINSASINLCCNNKLKSSGGFLWSYTENCPNFVKRRRPKSKGKIYIFKSPNGILLEAPNLKLFCEQYFLNYKSIRNIIGKKTITKYLNWTYLGSRPFEDKEIMQWL